MDANGTRFQLLLGAADWGRCRDSDGRRLDSVWAAGTPADVAYDDEREELTLRRLPFLFRQSAGADTILDPGARRGAARDRFGNWYWIDAVPTAILVSSSGTGATTRFWAVGDPIARPAARAGHFRPLAAATPPPPRQLAGAAVTEDHYLVVGVINPPGLLIFDLRSGGPPEELGWPAEPSLAPFDLAARPGGGIYLLDREHRRYWELDRHFLVLARPPAAERPPAAFEPVGGQGAEPGVRVCFRPPALEDAVALDAEATPSPEVDPVAIESMPDGTVLILFRNGAASSVRAYRDGAPTGPALPLAVPTADPAAERPLSGHDLAFVVVTDPAGAASSGTLFVADQHGDQSFAFAVGPAGGTLELSPVERYYPMRLFGGKALVAAGGQAYYDVEDRWLPLAEQRLQRFVATATVLTGLLDGHEPGCVWHRLLLDACLPGGETTVAVSAAASDDPRALESFPSWAEQPALYPRGDGSEQPFAPRDPVGAYRTWELLFQQVRGRYLRLKLELAGNQRATPRVRALRAYYPRFSYLERYLPAVYREDEPSASFVERFLANLEGISTTIEGRIATAQVLFDPVAAPADGLAWLASWFDLAMDPTWDERTRRLLLGHAMEFLQWRGTTRGLQTALALALEKCLDVTVFSDRPPACARRVRIVERYQTRVTPAVVLGDPSDPTAPPAPGDRWRPADGTPELDRRYREALRAAGLEVGDDARFPTAAPDDPDDPDASRRAAAWAGFARQALGFVPAGGPAVLPLWHDFLARRYQRLADLNAAYQLLGAAAVTGFDQLPLPAALPLREPARTDWLHFQGVVVPSSRTAHRFRVLLPVTAGTRAGQDAKAAAELGAQLEVARRIVELEKPVHTVFDVKFYWEAFRVGEARLGLDTLVDLGGRSPSLLGRTVLGRAYLGESDLASPSAVSRSWDRSVIDA